MKLKFYTFLFVILLHECVFSQREADSLRHVIATAKHDTTVMSAYTELIQFYIFSNPDSADFYFAKAEKHLAKTKNIEGEIDLLILKGNKLWTQGDLPGTRKLYFQADALAEKHNLTKKRTPINSNLYLSYKSTSPDSAKLFFNRSKRFAHQAMDSIWIYRIEILEIEALVVASKFDSALLLLPASERFVKKHNKADLYFRVLYSYALIYFRTGLLDKALFTFLEAEKIAEQLGVLHNKETVTSNISIVYAQKGDLKNAEIYNRKALDYARQLKNPMHIAVCLANFFEVLVEQKKTDEAEPLGKEAAELVELYDIKHIRPSLEVNYAKFYVLKKNYALSEKHLKAGIEAAHEQDLTEWLVHGYKVYIVLDTLKGDYKAAFAHKDSFLTYDKILKNNELQQKLEELEIKYKSAEKEQENSLLKFQKIETELSLRNINIALWSIAAIAFLLIILIVIVLKNRRKMQRAYSEISERNFEISEQREEIMQQSERLTKSLTEVKTLTQYREDLTQMLVHDLKNPLNVLLNLPEKMSELEKDEIRLYTSANMLNLVLNILDVSKYETAELKISPKIFGIIASWNSLTKHFALLLKQKNIRISVHSESEINVFADKALTYRILLNLLSNAYKYAPAGGEISLSAELIDANLVKITVSDNGEGMTEEDIQKIFQKYGQAGSSQTYSTGLGLLFCKIAVTAHGGTITIQSEKGKGTHVSFTLPISEKPVTEHETIQAVEAGNDGAKLSETEILKLKPYAEILRSADLSQTSMFRKLIAKFEEIEHINAAWTDELRNVVFTQNYARYQELITDIIQIKTDENL